MSGRKTTYDLEKMSDNPYGSRNWAHEDAKKNWNCEFCFGEFGHYSPTKDTKVVHLHFADKQSRDNYLKINDHPLENLMLKYIGSITFRVYGFDYYWNNRIYDDYSVTEMNDGRGTEWITEQLNGLGGTIVGVADFSWDMNVDYPFYSSDPVYPTAMMKTNNHTVRFLYTCDFDYDPNMIAVMDLQQAKSTYKEITFVDPDENLSLEEIKEHINHYCNPQKLEQIIRPYKETKSPITPFPLPGIQQEFNPVTIVHPNQTHLTKYSHQYYVFDGKSAKLTICAIDDPQYHPSWAKTSGHKTAWYDTPPIVPSIRGGNLRTASLKGEGSFISFLFYVYLGYQLDFDQTRELAFHDGYGEAVEQIEAAIQAAQELKSLYIQYRDEFETKFKETISKPEYADLMLNEELLTIYDSGPEVAVINEQLFHMGYGFSVNGYKYTSETYDGVIKFKNYMKELDSDLYDILEVDTPCGDESIHSRCKSNSQDGPCGCYTYSCYVFKEITFRATEDEAQLKWTDTSEVHSPFKDIVATNVTIDGTSRVFVDNGDVLGNRSIKATVNNGYEVKVRISAHGYLNNNTGNLIKLAPDDNDASTNIPLTINGEFLTPFASPTGDAYYLDLTLRGSDVLNVDAVVDINKPFLIGLNRTSPTGQNKSIDVGEVTLFSNGPFSIEKLELEVLDVRPPYADWKIHGHSSPPGWGRVNGVAGITLVAENFSDGLFDTAPACSFGIQIEIFLGIEIFYVFEIEIGGFVGLKLNFGDGDYAHNFISGKYIQASVDIGLAKASGRLESTDEWEWKTPKQLGYAVKDWLNDFIELVDADYKLPLPKGYAGRTSKTTSKVETEVLGQTVSQTHETQENAVSLEFVNDSSPILNTLQIYSNQSKDKTRISFGRKWSDGQVGANAPTYPSASVSVTNPTIKQRALSASIQYLANVLEIPPESVVFSVASWASKYGHLASFWKTYQNATKLFSMGDFANFGGKTGITWDYELYVGLKFMFEEWLDLGNSDFNSGPSETVIETQLNQNAQNWTFGAGLDFNAKAAIGFKIYTYPCAFVSVYFGAKLKFELSASPEWDLIGPTTWGGGPQSTLDLVTCLENQEGQGGW